jgi:aspartyl protease family protein
MKYQHKIIFSIIIHFLLLCNSINISAQSILTYNNLTFQVYQIKIDSEIGKKLKIIPNYSVMKFQYFLEENILNNDSDIFITNACINDVNGAPIGLVKSNETEISSLNLNDGSGNFYLKPNGFIAITEDDAIISESIKYNKINNVIHAAQSGPMLISDNKINSQFNPNSTNKNIRSGVGIYSTNNQKYLLFAQSITPVSFHDFASFFQNYNCSNALCLESVNCATYQKQIPIKTGDLNKKIGSYIVYKPNFNLTKKLNSVKLVRVNAGVYEIPVELNGVLKINFIFDSGASDVSISPDVALTLIRTGTIKDDDFIGTQTYSFADGSTATSRVFILKQIKIGNTYYKNIRASISNSIDAPMLLGQSVLQRIGKFTIDNNTNTLIIQE